MSRIRDIKNEIKYYRQRAKQGYSDRDVWNGGDHILKVTAGVLRELGDEKSHIDWDEYFRTNYQTRGYNSLHEVAQDIENYLAFDDVSWADTLGFEIKHKSIKIEKEGDKYDGMYEWVSDNTPDEERRIRIAIRKHYEEEKRLFEKCKNAMIFVAINARGLWD